MKSLPSNTSTSQKLGSLNLWQRFLKGIHDYGRVFVKMSILFVAFLGFKSAKAQEALGQEKDSQEPIGYLNWKVPTWGGQQYWTDVHFRMGWHIQRNAATGHFRLLDEKNTRHAWGNQAHCQQVLQQIVQEGRVPKVSGRVIVVLHGLIRTRNSMSSLADFLQRETDATVINFEYASTRETIADSAGALAELLKGLGDQVTRVDFVGHSMGNIVVRHYLRDLEREENQSTPPTFGRMVMLGPPNQGSRMARLLNHSLLFNAVTGQAGIQLGKAWPHLEKSLTTPPFEFAIISGGAENDRLIDNWLLSGPNDFTVSAKETFLAGATDSSMMPLLHGTMMKHPEVHQQVHSFLEHGYLVSADRKQPLTAADLKQVKAKN